MRGAAQESDGRTFDKVSPYGGSKPKAVSGRGARWATPTAPSCPNLERPSWLLDRWHCGQDHHLEQTYGVRCEGYWQLFNLQGGRCALCGGQPRGWRLVPHHDHETGEIPCLLHFTCNRLVDVLLWLLPRLVALMVDPPGRQLGLKVPKAKREKLQRKDTRKRQRPSPTRTKPPTDIGHNIRVATRRTEGK